MKVTTRLVDGKYYLCSDTGCDDPERAERNREIIKNHSFVEAYIIAEQGLDRTPMDRLVEKGELPLLSLKEIMQRGKEEEYVI